ncbi:MAG: 50S ribosomal protein L19 [Ardenticatenia bacterium]|nr:50S ribosomal protein L19 [Ardenticatenia bacterium]
MDLVQLVENEQLERLSAKKEVPRLRPGDVVRVHLRIVEGNRERVQVFEGTIIALKGRGVGRTITVRRIASHGVGVERIFPIYSPRVEKIEIVRHSHVRRAKLYYLRKLRGKKARLRQRFITEKKPKAPPKSAPQPTPKADQAEVEENS